MKRILFQGDSITDVHRSRENDDNPGFGYSLLVRSELGLDYPGEYEFYNRGIGGNRSIDVYARIKKDIINLNPDVMSVLVGVNDVWHEIAEKNGIDEDKYRMIYSMLIEDVKNANPNIKIMILEPFVLKGFNTEEKWDEFKNGVYVRAAICKELAQKYALSFIPLQEKFDIASKSMPNEYWLGDGVHPTCAGHEIIAREWIKKFKEEMSK